MVSWFYHLIHICLSFLTACCVLMPGGRIQIWQKRSGSDIWIWIRLKGSGSNIWIRTNKAGLYMKCTYCPSGKNSWHTAGVNCTILLLLLHLIKIVKYVHCTVRKFSCYVTDYAIAHCTALWDEKFSQIEGNCRKFSITELCNISSSVIFSI